MADAYLTAISAVTPAACFRWTPGAGSALPLPTEYWHDDTPGRLPGDWFDALRDLPGIKHRYLNDTSRYGLAATLKCLSDKGDDSWYGADEERRGIYVGTAVADFAVRRQLDYAVMREGAAAVNTVAAPNISANIAAAHIAIASRSRAFATTIPSPLLAGFEALFLAVQAVDLNRADSVLSVAAEESLSDADDERVLPGAVALQLGVSGRAAGIRISASAWGYLGTCGDEMTLPSIAQVLLRQASDLASQGNDVPQILLIRDASDVGQVSALRWLRWIADAGMNDRPYVDRVFRSPGAVEPLLWAATWLTRDRPILLIAIHQRRYLAFLSIP